MRILLSEPRRQHSSVWSSKRDDPCALRERHAKLVVLSLELSEQLCVIGQCLLTRQISDVSESCVRVVSERLCGSVESVLGKDDRGVEHRCQVEHHAGCSHERRQTSLVSGVEEDRTAWLVERVIPHNPGERELSSRSFQGYSPHVKSPSVSPSEVVQPHVLVPYDLDVWWNVLILWLFLYQILNKLSMFSEVGQASILL